MKMHWFSFVLPMMLFGCGIEVNEAPRETEEDPKSVPAAPANPEPIAIKDPCDRAIEAPDVIYGVKRNSRLEVRTYDVGQHLEGRIYAGAYLVDHDACDKDVGTRDLYERDLKGMWIEISQLQPYDPAFLKTYYVPEEAISFRDQSEDMGLIIDPSYIIIDASFAPGHDYLLRLKLENQNGVVTSAKAWNNDMEAFQSIGFTMKQAPDEQLADTAGR